MKFQDSSFNGLKVTVGTKSVTHARTHPRSKSNMPHQLFQSWGHKKPRLYCTCTTYWFRVGQLYLIKGSMYLFNLNTETGMWQL